MGFWTPEEKAKLLEALDKRGFSDEQRRLHEAVLKEFPEANLEDMIALLGASAGAWLGACAAEVGEKPARDALARIGPVAELLFDETLRRIRQSKGK